jgi:vancomycin resistance protein YoaR
VAASSSAVHVRRRASARGRFWPRLFILAVAAAIITIGLGLIYAGSPDKLANGTRIAGIDVGGLTPSAARRLLERRAERVSHVPVVFTAGNQRFSLTPSQLGVEVDWKTAVANARKQGDGFGFVRGYRRLELAFFPQDLVPPIRAYGAALTYELELLAKAVNRPHQEAQLVRRGLHITISAGTTGRSLDKPAAREVLVRSLASFSRESVVGLPVRVDAPHVTVATLTSAQQIASRIVAAPVTLIAGPKRLKLPRWRLAKLLDLSTMRFSGPAADAYFARLEKTVDTPPKDADFAITSNGNARVVPSQPGLGLDVPRSAARILVAASRVANRNATLVLAEQQPKRTTADAQAMGITGTVATYETFYGGIANRIHNVQLVAHLVDRKFIAPGETFSFNGTTGERSAAKGFLTAPVIVNGELQNGLGGGVCQVSTTVFNAAYEAGLPITERTNHALYISHYPLGRDATVDYPSVDLKFVNDTKHWLLLRTFVGPSSLIVGLYGTPQHRRVETTTAPLRVVAPAPIKRTVDATLKPGEVVVDNYGAPAQATSVERKVFNASGKLLSDATWYSSYRAEPKIVRVGPKKKAKKTVTTPAGLAPAAPH